MEFSGEFDAHLMNWLKSLQPHHFQLSGVLFINTLARESSRGGLYPTCIEMLSKPSDVKNIERHYYPSTLEKILSIEWENEKLYQRN